MERLFNRLAIFYGSKFSRMWHGIDAEEMKSVWGDALRGFTVTQVKDAVNRCLCEPEPPNLPQFVMWCRTYAQNDVRKIEPPPMDRERAKAMLSEVKRRYFSKGEQA